jgi:hypothetical protein
MVVGPHSWLNPTVQARVAGGNLITTPVHKLDGNQRRAAAHPPGRAGVAESCLSDLCWKCPAPRPCSAPELTFLCLAWVLALLILKTDLIADDEGVRLASRGLQFWLMNGDGPTDLRDQW